MLTELIRVLLYLYSNVTNKNKIERVNFCNFETERYHLLHNDTLKQMELDRRMELPKATLITADHIFRSRADCSAAAAGIRVTVAAAECSRVITTNDYELVEIRVGVGRADEIGHVVACLVDLACSVVSRMLETRTRPSEIPDTWKLLL